MKFREIGHDNFLYGCKYIIDFEKIVIKSTNLCGTVRKGKEASP